MIKLYINDLATFGSIKGNDGSKSTSSNSWTTITSIIINKGSYILWGYLNFQSSSNTGSRCLRFVTGSTNSYEFEIQGNNAGYTQIQVPALYYAASDNITISLQARQVSGNNITVSGVLRSIKVGDPT